MKDILTTEEAADYLSLSPVTIRNYARTGILPARKAGKGWRFYRGDLLAWVLEKETPKEN